MNPGLANMLARKHIRDNTKGMKTGEGVIVVRDCGTVVTYGSLASASREHGSYIYQWTLKNDKIELFED